jgi:hypothetical protein
MRFNCCSSCRISSRDRAENTFSIVAACARKIGVMTDLPRGVKATMRTLRSWEDSARLTKPFATSRSTATLIDPGVGTIHCAVAEFWRIQLPRRGQSVAEFARIQSGPRDAPVEKRRLFLVPSLGRACSLVRLHHGQQNSWQKGELYEDSCDHRAIFAGARFHRLWFERFSALAPATATSDWSSPTGAKGYTDFPAYETLADNRHQ